MVLAENESAFKEIRDDKKFVLLTSTYYSYDPGKKNQIINEILKDDVENRAWVASRCNTFYESNELASFGLRCVYSGMVYREYFCITTGGLLSSALNLRPIISFPATRLDIINTLNDGSQSKAWNIK